MFIGYHLISFSHKREHIDFTLSVYDEVMGIIKSAIDDNCVRGKLIGDTVTQIFKNVGDRSAKD